MHVNRLTPVSAMETRSCRRPLFTDSRRSVPPAMRRQGGDIVQPTIPEAVPTVADDLTKRGGSRLVGLSQVDRKAVREAATLLAEFAEDPVRELVVEEPAALDEGEMDVPMPESPSERVAFLRWMLAKCRPCQFSGCEPL